MPSTAYVFLIGLPIAAVLGPLLVRASAGPRRRLGAVPDRLTKRFSRPIGLLAGAGIAWAAFAAIGIVLGEIAHALESAIDEPAFDWAKDQYDLSAGFFHNDWYRWNNTLTKMGNTLQTRELVVLASVALAALWWRRRFWIPPVVITGTYLVAWASQHAFVVIVDRGHPPLTFGTLSLGTWPSGGCMRIVSVWGIIAVLLVRTFPRAPRWFGGLLAVLVSVAAWTEAYTRIYLLKHWLTDVVGGLLMGVVLLLLATVVTTAWIDEPAASPAGEPDLPDPVVA